MRYAAFQSLYGRSDPRSVLVFQQPYAEVLPHIVVQAEELSAPIKVYDPVVAAAGAGTPTGSNSSGVASHGTSFKEAFTEAFDGGMWLVVKDASLVDYVEWRQIGVRLASVLPDTRFRLRSHFRLFVFLQENQQFSHIVPPLLNQFAIIVDSFGNVQARTDVSPIFSGPSNVAGGGDFVPLGPTGQENRHSNERENDRSKPYTFFHQARDRALDMKSNRTPATDPDYVDEVLCSCRDELLQHQSDRMEEMQKEVEERLQRTMLENQQATAYNDGHFSEGDPDMSAKDPVTERERIIVDLEREYAEHYDWVYSRILEWVIEQCPDADLSALPEIPATDLTTEEVAWQTLEETCHTGMWAGSEVLVKELVKSYASDVNDQLKHMFSNEAARHFRLRHPKVLAVYGLSEGRLVLERGPGTLEQALIRARYEDKRWSIRRLLVMAQQVLQGMCYLSTQIVHRDIASRSVIEIDQHTFKIGQFACAIPLKHSPVEAKSGKIPVRWTAPEGFAGDFTPASDMWSFGVLLWEAVQYAVAVPYSNEPFAAKAIVRQETLQRPPECSEQFFDSFIHPCWEAEPENRPTANKMLVTISHALTFWPAADLDKVIPFPTDATTFEEYNATH